MALINLGFAQPLNRSLSLSSFSRFAICSRWHRIVAQSKWSASRAQVECKESANWMKLNCKWKASPAVFLQSVNLFTLCQFALSFQNWLCQKLALESARANPRQDIWNSRLVWLNPLNSFLTSGTCSYLLLVTLRQTLVRNQNLKVFWVA